MCRYSPIGFAYFANLLARQGDLNVGYQFTLLADALLKKLDGAKDVAGEVLCIHCETEAFLKPLQTLSYLRKRAENESLVAGGEL